MNNQLAFLMLLKPVPGMKRGVPGEKGQVTVEYILFVGGVLVVVLVISLVYREAVINAGNALLASVNQTTGAVREEIMKELAKL